MTTVDKALEILDLFSESRPSLGLSEAARLLDRDKASVLRYLAALERQGFLEQDPLTRAYQLGPAVARLALLREMTYPVNQAARNILRKLVGDTQETAHLTHFEAGQMTHVALIETAHRGTRVYIDPAERLPLHASASGLAYLSACAPEDRKTLLSGRLKPVTAATPTDRAEVLHRVEQAADRGYAVSRGGIEIDVCGIAAPVFGAAGSVCGAVAVAAPLARVTEALEPRIAQAVITAAAAISRHYGAPRLPSAD